MGVQIGDLVPKKKISLSDLSGRVIGVDGHNVTYQFLARIRKRSKGEPLKDNMGRVTSHLSGTFYRVSNFIEAGIKPVFVWDGKPPRFKRRTIQARSTAREEAARRWTRALERGEEAMVYAQASSKLTSEMVEESIYLLDCMGVPSLRAPSEGEAQLAMMAVEGDIWASASQDWDSLLFNSPRLVRNLSITGRRKLPRKPVYIEIKPELIDLKKTLKNLGITREQLIVTGMLIGTDYNAGVKGVGPKTALRLVKEYDTVDRLLEKVEWTDDFDFEEVFNFFLNPATTDNYEIKWKAPDTGKLVEFMVEEHDFSRSRVEKVAEILEKSITEKEGTLEDFFS
jgi:flap endonuclease-1